MVDLAGIAPANLNLGGVLARRNELQHATSRLSFIGILRSPSQGR